VGVEKDLMTAFTWCKKAVDQNHEDAKVELEAILLELEDLTKALESKREELVLLQESSDTDMPVEIVESPEHVPQQPSISRSCCNPNCASHARRHSRTSMEGRDIRSTSFSKTQSMSGSTSLKFHYCSDSCRSTHGNSLTIAGR